MKNTQHSTPNTCNHTSMHTHLHVQVKALLTAMDGMSHRMNDMDSRVESMQVG